MATATPPLTIQPTPTANIGVLSGAGMCGTGLSIGVAATRGLDLTGVTLTAGAAYIADDLAQPFHCQACEKASALCVSRPLDFEHADRRQPIGVVNLDWLRPLGPAAPAWTSSAPAPSAQ